MRSTRVIHSDSGSTFNIASSQVSGENEFLAAPVELGYERIN
jgi:hypothetical protein